MTTTDMILQVPQGAQSEININYLNDTYTVKFIKNTDESRFTFFVLFHV